MPQRRTEALTDRWAVAVPPTPRDTGCDKAPSYSTATWTPLVSLCLPQPSQLCSAHPPDRAHAPSSPPFLLLLLGDGLIGSTSPTRPRSGAAMADHSDSDSSPKSSSSSSASSSSARRRSPPRVRAHSDEGGSSDGVLVELPSQVSSPPRLQPLCHLHFDTLVRTNKWNGLRKLLPLHRVGCAEPRGRPRRWYLRQHARRRCHQRRDLRGCP